MRTPLCPACGQPISIAVLRERMSGYLNVVGRRAGIVCGSCATRLALDAKRPIILAICGLAIFVGASFFLRTLPNAPYTVWNLLAVVPLLLALMFGQTFARVRMPRSDERLRVHGDAIKQLEEELEPIRAMNQSEAAAEAARIQDINASNRARWNCAKCNAENPATFDLCWHCQDARPET